MIQIASIVKWLIANPKTLFKAICGLAVGFLLWFSINTYKQNKELSQSLELAQNNIEAYQGVINDSQQANNVLQLTVEDLQNYNDKLINQIDSVRKELKIKTDKLNSAATQTQIIHVNDGKEVGGDLVEILKDTTYTDSIKYNPLTTVHYTIGRDTVSISLDIENTQYLLIYKTREYKNDKNFFQRLFTLDFKKVDKYKYDIKNTNDLIDTKDVRVIEMRY